MALSNNPLKEYDAIAANTAVKFLSGSQANVNTMINNGGAVEGAFYLTTDTHKLYVGRKKGNSVYPEQVSRGVTIVATSEDLPSTTPSGAIEEGELFYITNKNILAALVKNAQTNAYEWQQINPPTGLNGYSVDINPIADNTAALVAEKLTAGDGTEFPVNWAVDSGTNIEVAPTSVTYNDANSGNSVTVDGISISAAEYALGITTNASQANVTLSNSLNSNQSTELTFVGSGTVGVSANASTNTITVAGPTFSGISVDTISASTNANGGFTLTLEGDTGSGGNFSASGTLAPNIAYGENTVTAVFNSGTALLNVYTSNETDSKISAAIQSALQVADALTYKGVINNASGFTAALNNHSLNNGDVFKVVVVGDQMTIGGTDTAKTGDMIIIQGNETTDGYIAAANVTDLLANYAAVIPAGNEPIPAGYVSTDSTGANTTSTVIYDYSVGNNDAGTILKTDYNGGNLINITSNATPALNNNKANGAYANITISHNAVTRTDTTNSGLVSTSGSDTIGSGTYKLLVLNPNVTSSKFDAFSTDAYGHITGIKGNIITFKHNKLSSLALDYNNNGSITLTATDDINSSVNTTFAFTSNTLAISPNASGNSMDVNLVWGTF